jgi:hypothetical protein
METGWPDLQQRRGESELEKMENRENGSTEKGKKKKKKGKREKEIVKMKEKEKKKKKLKKGPVCPFFLFDEECTVAFYL